MLKKQKTKSVSPEQQRANYERLRKMMGDLNNNPVAEKLNNPVAEKLKELEALLTEKNQPITLEEAAKILGTNAQGIRDLRATYRSPDMEIEIFSETERKLDIWYVKINKKKQL